MFLGEYLHSLDAKGRVIVPARHRELLGEEAVMAKALDGCLAIYTKETFLEVAAQAREIAKRGARERQAARVLFAGATEVVPDKQGRVAIPPNLREYADLDREVIVAGNYHRVELWDARKFRERQREGDLSMLDAEGVAEIGM